jgi:DegV family protein with EDD domain
MNKIKIITDCTSDLTFEIYEKYDIDVIPLYVTIGGKTYADVLEINSEMLYQKVEEFGELPKTSTIAPIAFATIFKKYIDLGYDILFIGIGSAFSAVFQNATIVSREFPKGRIRIVDSQNLSSATGLLLLKAIRYRDAGDDLETIATKVEKAVPLIRTQFAINTLDYLHKGGRCSGTERLFGTLLKIRPIIRVLGGKMQVAKKPRGKFNVALETLLEYVTHDKDIIDLKDIMITHSLNEPDAKYLRRRLGEIINAENIIETKASGVISTHCGPKTIGILYCLKNDI